LLREKTATAGWCRRFEGCGMDYAHLTDLELHRKRAGGSRRPTDPIDWQANIGELRALAIEISARMAQAPAGVTKDAQVM
jgi:hypothetical protein